jgi:uridine kinase
MDTMVIGIAGGTGSGKTTLTEKLKERFTSNVSVLYHDNYYKKHVGMTYDERSKLNYDHPDAFDNDLIIQDLKALREGKAIQCPVYDYTIHNRSDKTLEVKPTQVIIVEGILIFAEPALRELMDIKIFVDTDADVRILRRVMRDVKERERTLDSVVSQYLTTVKPMHEAFVEPSKKYADIIVPQGGRNQVALDMLVERIRGHVEKWGK